MRVSMIWAMAKNRVIGRGDGLPWHLPKDLAFFKSVTLGKPVIMGRRTFETLGGPLPGRANIVLSRSGRDYPGASVAADLDGALHLAAAHCERDGKHECFIAGGADIYALAAPRADRLYATLIDAELEGDTFFPPLEFKDYRVVSTENHPADAEHAYPFTVRILDRIPVADGSGATQGAGR